MATTILNHKQRAKLIADSSEIESASNGELQGDQYYHARVLYHHPKHGYYLIDRGGVAMYRSFYPEWLTDSEALDWLSTKPTHPVTGYGYTEAEARRLMAGESILEVRGSRDL